MIEINHFVSVPQTYCEANLFKAIEQADSLAQLQSLHHQIPPLKVYQEAYVAKEAILKQEQAIKEEIEQADSLAQLESLRHRIPQTIKIMGIYIDSMMKLSNEKQILEEINQATQARQLEDIKARMPRNAKTLAAYQARIEFLLSGGESRYLNFQKRISTFADNQGNEFSEEDLIARIRNQIPPNTYIRIKVSTLASYQFVHQCIRARKIELIREECGFARVVEAGFSACFVTDSVYRQVIDDHTLMKGVLASSDIIENKARKENFTKQMTAAYWSGYKIEIIYPFDFSENGVVNLTSTFKSLTFSIDAGRWIRNLFTHN